MASVTIMLCCLEMFGCWLEGSRGIGEFPRTWSTTLSAVGGCLGRDVADSIERALLLQTHGPTTPCVSWSDPLTLLAKEDVEDSVKRKRVMSLDHTVLGKFLLVTSIL